MSISIISLLNRYPEEIAKTIDLTFQLTSATGEKYRRGLPDPALKKFIPMLRYAMAKLALQKIGERRPTLASIVGVDGEIPIRREPVDLSIETVGSAKLARGRLFTEEDFDLMREAEMNLAVNNPQAYQAFVDRYMQTPAYLTQTIVSLASVLLLQLFSTGVCAYIDPETGLGFELSYLSQVPVTNRPAAPATLWSVSATATPLSNIKDHLNSYYGNVFMMPEAIVLSSAIADAILNADDTKIKIGRLQGRVTDSATPGVGFAASLPRPSLEECRQWLTREITAAAQSSVGVPEIIVSDANYFTIAANGMINPNGTPYFASNTYWFANSALVEGAFVPTATNDYASTMAFVTEDVSKSPRREKATIDTKFLALCSDPRLLGWRQVLA
jgi:hypothetical protein